MKGIRALIGPRPDCLGDSLAVELSALTRAALVRIQVPQPSATPDNSLQPLMSANLGTVCSILVRASGPAVC